MIALRYPFAIEDPRALHDALANDGHPVAGVSVDGDPARPATLIYLDAVEMTEEAKLDVDRRAKMQRSPPAPSAERPPAAGSDVVTIEERSDR